MRQGLGFRVWSLGFAVRDSGAGIQGTWIMVYGFSIQSSWVMVYGSDFMAQCLGYGIEGKYSVSANESPPSARKLLV